MYVEINLCVIEFLVFYQEQLSISSRQNPQYLPQPTMPAYRPHPSQYGYAPPPAPLQAPWGGAGLGYPPASPGPGGGPTRRGMGRSGQMSIPSDIDDEFYTLGEDCYEDDGSQPAPAPGMYGGPEQLEQNWPFGHKTGLEGNCAMYWYYRGSVLLMTEIIFSPLYICPFKAKF